MDINLPSIAGELTTALTPILPYVLNVGEKILDKPGDKVSEAVWSRGVALWEKLWPNVKNKHVALEAARKVALTPDDEDARAALRLQLKKVLTDDSALSTEIIKLLEETRSSGVTISLSGNRSVVIGRDVINSHIITGDRNNVKP
jgi:hypothetical protein